MYKDNIQKPILSIYAEGVIEGCYEVHKKVPMSSNLMEMTFGRIEVGALMWMQSNRVVMCKCRYVD